jgi:hypothetical protein
MGGGRRNPEMLKKKSPVAPSRTEKQQLAGTATNRITPFAPRRQNEL